MNERIKELMLMAFQEHYGDPITPVTREKAVELVSGWGEKFAELIVRECLTFVEPMPGSGDIDDLALEAAHNSIKEHFGVEE